MKTGKELKASGERRINGARIERTRNGKETRIRGELKDNGDRMSRGDRLKNAKEPTNRDNKMNSDSGPMICDGRRTNVGNRKSKDCKRENGGMMNSGGRR